MYAIIVCVSSLLSPGCVAGAAGRERRPLGGDAAPAYCRRLAERHQEAQEVQPGEEGEHERQGEHQGPVPDDQEDAAASEGVGQVLHPPPPRRGVHEELPGRLFTFFLIAAVLQYRQ